jgi:chemotaxis protein methyltransferase CheR
MNVELQLRQSEFTNLRDLIYHEAGITIRDNKRQLLQSRLRKRLRVLQLASYAEYFDYLTKSDRHGDELIQMINCVSTNKTDFFRENHHFDFLREVLFPQMIADSYSGGPRKLRIWSAACSTGEEPYSIAMTAHDCFADERGWDIQILASDIDTEVLDRAERGVYDVSRIGGTPPDLLHRHFENFTDEDGKRKVRVKPYLRDMITFRRINFAEPRWPIQSKFDAIFCRNVMIYFDDATQDKLVTRFADYLAEGKHLMLGHSESIRRVEGLYKSLGKTTFRRLPSGELNAENPLTRGAPTVTPTSTPTSTLDRTRTVQHQGAAPGRLSSAVPTNMATLPQDQTAAHDSAPKHPIIVGELHASAAPVWITTLLGSCVAACLFDPTSGVGGMNHFLLPDGTGDRETASYGIHAMELLINEIMKLGGDRRQLQAKVFGGSQILQHTSSSTCVGTRNGNFVKEFLSVESIPIVGELLGGDTGMQVQFLSSNGRARVRRIEGKRLAAIAPPRRPVLAAQECDSDSVTLF